VNRDPDVQDEGHQRGSVSSACIDDTSKSYRMTAAGTSDSTARPFVSNDATLSLHQQLVQATVEMQAMAENVSRIAKQITSESRPTFPSADHLEISPAASPIPGQSASRSSNRPAVDPQILLRSGASSMVNLLVQDPNQWERDEQDSRGEDANISLGSFEREFAQYVVMEKLRL
jgi:hypothetical protein